MRLSQLFTKTSKNIPAEEPSKNAQLLIRAGYVYKEMAGVYTFLPLGLKVINNISRVIRQEMNKVGGQEIYMPALQVKERYQATGRWDDKVVDDWFKTRLVNGTELGLGFSHEEDLSPMLKNFISSYKDLPLLVYQIQTKFRNELRSKSGLMRGREFLMKDMYSFTDSPTQHQEVYDMVKGAYFEIFKRLGIGDRTYLTSASGGSFSKYSHEFQTICPAGEDIIYLDRKKKVAINREVLTDDVIKDLGLERENLEEIKAIEVGNIFTLGSKFSKPFNLNVADKDGKAVNVLMGCYGIGVSRVMGAITEVLGDDKGLVWPKEISPALVYLARLGNEAEVLQASDVLYNMLTSNGVEVIYDDRDIRSGEKFADADLSGIPYRLVVSSQTVTKNAFELKGRLDDSVRMVDQKQLLKELTS